MNAFGVISMNCRYFTNTSLTTDTYGTVRVRCVETYARMVRVFYITHSYAWRYGRRRWAVSMRTGAGCRRDDAGRPGAGTCWSTCRTWTGAVRCACDCVWWGSTTGWTPCRTDDTRTASHLHTPDDDGPTANWSNHVDLTERSQLHDTSSRTSILFLSVMACELTMIISSSGHYLDVDWSINK